VDAVLAEILECLYSSSDRRRAVDIVEQLRHLGIAAVFVPSAHRIGTWDVEVPVCDAVRARLVVEGLRVY
jgi:hypothetical protein